MQIPETKQTPSVDYDKVTMLLYGDPKIGKSTFCSRFENAFFIATEPGLNFLETYNLRANTWEDCWEIIEALTYSRQVFSPIVVDTIDKLWDFCCEFAARQFGVQSVNQVGFGRGTDLAKVELKKFIQSLIRFNVGLIFTSHAAFEELTDPTTGESIKKFIPSADKKYVRPIINPLVDIIGYVSIQKDYDENKGELVEKRVFHAHNGVLWEAGDRTGRLPAQFPFSQAVYKSFFEKTKEV